MQNLDPELLKAARAGNSQALNRLLAEFEKPVYRFGLRMCGSEDAAKEVLQQTLLTAFRSLKDFRGDAALSTWLYQIARSFCIKSRRKRVDEPATLESLHTPHAMAIPALDRSPEDSAHARQIGEALQAAISALPEHYREVLVLRDVEGLSAEEAAEVLGLEVANLKTRLHRARLEVRKHLTAVMEQGTGSGECPELAEQLTQYAAQEIDQATCADIEKHMAGCPRCAAACDTLKRTVSLCRAIPGDDVPAPVRAAVRKAIQSLTLNSATGD